MGKSILAWLFRRQQQPKPHVVTALLRKARSPRNDPDEGSADATVSSLSDQTMRPLAKCFAARPEGDLTIL